MRRYRLFQSGGAECLPRVIFGGRPMYEKGIQVLIEAQDHCRAAGWPFVLVIHGTGVYRPELEALIVARDLASLVGFRGVAQDEALVAALRSVDLAVAPSLCDETFGIVAIEAMACELPVVAANTGGLGGIVAELGDETHARTG